MREILAAALILLLLIISAWNIHRADTLGEKILLQLSQAESAALSDDWTGSAQYFEKALGLWEQAEAYSHIFIRHPEIDSCSDAFYDMEQSILSEDTGDMQAALHKLRHHILSIAGMEKIRIGNIL